jgi:drug/metabolite transporter (DMT)-like permease
MRIKYIIGVTLIISGILIVILKEPHLNGGVIAIIGGLVFIMIGSLIVDIKSEDK